MRAHKIATKEADDQYKRAAFVDNKFRSTVNKSRFSTAQITQALRMQMALELCYSCEKVYEPSFGKTLVSIKVANPRSVTNKAQLKLLEDGWEQAGVVKKVSPQGILYSFKRK